jgi:mercuric ion binding protein
MPIRYCLLSLLLASTFAQAAPKRVVLNIPTMDCATCPLTIRAALRAVPGVTAANVSYPHREAVVDFDDSKATIADLKKATADAGYPALLKTGR